MTPNYDQADYSSYSISRLLDLVTRLVSDCPGCGGELTPVFDLQGRVIDFFCSHCDGHGRQRKTLRPRQPKRKKARA